MKQYCKNRFFLLKKDISAALQRNRKGVIVGVIILLLGVVFGIYIAMNVGEQESPFGVFAALFSLKYTPFKYLIFDFLRFFLFLILASLAFFLPFPSIYPAVALLFFAKHFGEISCVVILSDSLPSAILSILIIYIPLLLSGGTFLIALSIHASEYRLVSGCDPCRHTVRGEIILILSLLLLYLLVLFAIHVIVCGVLYLIMIAI